MTDFTGHVFLPFRLVILVLLLSHWKEMQQNLPSNTPLNFEPRMTYKEECRVLEVSLPFNRLPKFHLIVSKKQDVICDRCSTWQILLYIQEAIKETGLKLLCYFQHGHPYISAMVNNGTLHYDHDRDGTHTEVAGCEAQFRNKPHDTYIAIRYERNTLSVSL